MLAHRWQTIPERGVVRSREPFKRICIAPLTILDSGGAEQTKMTQNTYSKT